jgi:hypothetical protein
VQVLTGVSCSAASFDVCSTRAAVVQSQHVANEGSVSTEGIRTLVVWIV